ncbi:MAG: Phosphate metabolism transcription protein [Candelina mexicana]|nr:MAG: Phosphate metabolism transcription protein [Candelina mexicana]
MRFGRTLRNTIYEPWKDHYIDYTKLKHLLRENSTPEKGSLNGAGRHRDQWTEDDEGRFVEELINVQLEKVNEWQVETYKQLRGRTSACESKLQPLLEPSSSDDPKELLKAPEQRFSDRSGSDGIKNADGDMVEKQGSRQEHESRQTKLREVLEELDSITKETNELEKYSRINFTGFLKAAKKHDRRRGRQYRVRPLLQVRLSALPFNSEDYSPLLYRLSAMYSIVRQNLDEGTGDRKQSLSDAPSSGEKYTSHKFWVHPDNILEVKTYILRRLPVLVYNPQTSKVAEGGLSDPTITSLYFDNASSSLYTQKVDREPDAASLRLRWYGQLSQKPEIFFEKKTIGENDKSEEKRFPCKEKYIQAFIKGEYKMEKTVQKLQDRQGQNSDGVEKLENTVGEIQAFIREKELQPVLRANYTRTAFQIPGDDRVRVSLDTDLALIREDSLDSERPCRDPEDWHRNDIDSAEMEFPFNTIRKGEISRFPFALLEIKVKDTVKRKSNEWISDLMSSHLVKEAPRFSKFVHGIAQLFEDYVNSFPFWLSDMGTDIRQDPEDAFVEEQEKKAKRAEDEFAVGSLLGSKSSPAFKPAVGSPVGSAPNQGKRDSSATNGASKLRERSSQSMVGDTRVEEDPDEDKQWEDVPTLATPSGGLRSFIPSFSTSKYARAKRQGSVQLPPGVRRPGTFIKDMGPIKVEPKVWLANQRTFIKWQHVSVLLASLSLGLYNAAGKTNNVARGLAVVYTLIAGFAGLWGWWMYIVRSRLIRERSGKDVDNLVGPIIVCVGLVIALCLNFAFKYRDVKARSDEALYPTNEALPDAEEILQGLFAGHELR